MARLTVQSSTEAASSGAIGGDSALKLLIQFPSDPFHSSPGNGGFSGSGEVASCGKPGIESTGYAAGPPASPKTGGAVIVILTEFEYPVSNSNPVAWAIKIYSPSLGGVQRKSAWKKWLPSGAVSLPSN